MRIKAKITIDGAFIPIFLKCKEFSMLNHVSFLIDTGSVISALSTKDLGDNINFNCFEKIIGRFV